MSEAERLRQPRVTFPRFSLRDAEALAEIPYKIGVGRDVAVSTIASALGLSETSSAFESRVAAARWFGLIEPSGSGLYRATRLCISLFDPPGGEQDRVKARQIAFLNYERFRKLYELLPPTRVERQRIGSLAVMHCDIPPSRKEEFVSIFLDSAEYAKLVVIADDVVHRLDVERGNTNTTLREEKQQNGSDVEPQYHSTLKEAGSRGFASLPSLHIDLQIHFSPDMTESQIDQVFKSIAKYLYGREV